MFININRKVFKSLDELIQFYKINPSFKVRLKNELTKSLQKDTYNIVKYYIKSSLLLMKLKANGYSSIRSFLVENNISEKIFRDELLTSYFNVNVFISRYSFAREKDYQQKRLAEKKAKDLLNHTSFTAWLKTNPDELKNWSEKTIKLAYQQANSRQEMTDILNTSTKKIIDEPIQFKGKTYPFAEIKKLTKLTIPTLRQAVKNHQHDQAKFDIYLEARINEQNKKIIKKSNSPIKKINVIKAFGWEWSSILRFRNYYNLEKNRFVLDRNDPTHINIRIKIIPLLKQMRVMGLIGANNLYLPEHESKIAKRSRPVNFELKRLPPIDELDIQSTPDWTQQNSQKACMTTMKT